jgi:threonine dehydrogenase-like Zn-dependent dehydrogenase
VVVIGAGLIGTLVCWLLARTRNGTKVTLVDPRPARRSCAAKLVPSADVVASATPDARADVVISRRSFGARAACSADAISSVERREPRDFRLDFGAPERGCSHAVL